MRGSVPKDKKASKCCRWTEGRGCPMSPSARRRLFDRRNPGNGIGRCVSQGRRLTVLPARQGHSGSRTGVRTASEVPPCAIGRIRSGRRNPAKPFVATVGLPLVRGRVGFAVADGLGHGLIASDAATAISTRCASLRPGFRRSVLWRAAHQAAKPTRGAAFGVAVLDESAGSFGSPGSAILRRLW